MNNLLAVLNGVEKGLSDGAVVSIVSIALVFSILAIIIGITFVVNLVIQKTAKKEQSKEEDNNSSTPAVKTVTVDSEEAEVAVLVASIDYRNEIKKDIKVVSVKEIK